MPGTHGGRRTAATALVAVLATAGAVAVAAKALSPAQATVRASTDPTAASSSAPVTSPPAAPSAASSSPRLAPATAPAASVPLREVALGDSVPAGTACGCTPFPTLYARLVRARTGVAVAVDNRAVGGLTSAGLLTAISSSQAAGSLAAADIVTITIGANDFQYQGPGCTPASCYAAALSRMSANLDLLLTDVSRLRQGRPTAVRVTGYWAVWKDGQVGAQQGSDYQRLDTSLTAAVNAVIAAEATRHDVDYVDLMAPFRGPSGSADDTDRLADDGDHPNAAGHAAIAAALMAAGLAPLVPPP